MTAESLTTAEGGESLVAFCQRRLNLQSEGMETLRSAVAAGDGPSTEHALSLLWRQRLERAELPGETLPNLSAANELLADRLRLLNSGPFALGRPVDWRRFAEDHPQKTSHLAYMRWLEPLGFAFRSTRDERYAAKLLEFIESFLDHLPYGTEKLPWHPTHPAISRDELDTCDNGETSAVSGQWHSLSCHARIDAWLDGLARIREAAALTPPRLARILGSLFGEHARLIVANPRENTPNQFFSNSVSLLRLAAAFPEFHESEAYFQIAWSRVLRCVETLVLPDGAMLERSPNYNLNFPKELDRVCSILSNAPASRRAPLFETARRVSLVLSRLTTPDGRLLPIAKTHAQPAPIRHETFMNVGVIPPSFFLPWGGYAILRDVWNADATQLFFKNSGPSPGHMHEDCLHLGLFAQGRDLLVEAGNFNYNDATPLDRAMRDYCNATRGHNGIEVDGSSQNRAEQRFLLSGRTPRQTPDWAFFRRRLPHRAAEGEWFMTVEGTYEEGFGGADAPVRVRHHRRGVWIKRLGFLVIDRLTPEDERKHDYRAFWHLAPRFRPDQVEWDAEKRVLFTRSGETNLQISVHAPGALSFEKYYGEDEPCRGWMCLGYDRRVPKVDVMFAVNAAGPLTLVTLLRPVGGKDEPPFTPGRTGAAEFFGGGTDAIFCHETGVRVETADGDRTLQIPSEGALPLERANGGPARPLMSLAVDEQEGLARHFSFHAGEGSA